MPAILARLVPALLLAAVIIVIYYGPSTVKEAIAARTTSPLDRTSVLFLVIVCAAVAVILSVAYLLG